MSDSINKRLDVIETRNSRVEKDKAWETSLVRRSLVTILTYVVISGYLLVIDTERPFVAAVVPAVGYFMSTLVIKNAKNWWMTK